MSYPLARRKRDAATDSKHPFLVAQILLNRQFYPWASESKQIGAPNLGATLDG